MENWKTQNHKKKWKFDLETKKKQKKERRFVLLSFQCEFVSKIVNYINHLKRTKNFCT